MGCDTGAGQPSGIGMDLSQCGGACAPAVPPRRWFLADRIQASTRAANNQQVLVDLDSIPPVDRQGRIAHVLAIRFAGTYRYTLDETNDAVLGRNLLAQWAQLFLQDVGGNIYAATLDARDIRDDQYARSRMVDAAPQGLATDQGAGNVDTNIGFTWYLARNDRRGGAADLLGAIPLASLQAVAGNALRFMPIGSIPGVTPAGVTFAGFQGTINVFLEIVYLPVVLADPPWQIETYQITEVSGSLRHPDRMHEYAVLRHKVGDNGGEAIDDYGVTTVDCNGELLVNALSLAEYNQRDALVLQSDEIAAQQFLDSDRLPLASGTNLTMLALVEGNASRELANFASGRIGFNFSTRTRTSSRFLHRTYACQNPAVAATNVAAAGCDPKGTVIGFKPDGTPIAPQPGRRMAVVPTNLTMRR